MESSLGSYLEEEMVFQVEGLQSWVHAYHVDGLDFEEMTPISG